MAIEELIAILLTTVLVSITGYYARVTHKMLKIMQQQSEAITRPYLTINVFSEPHGVLYYLRIANTGEQGQAMCALRWIATSTSSSKSTCPTCGRRQYSSSRSSNCLQALK